MNSSAGYEEAEGVRKGMNFLRSRLFLTSLVFVLFLAGAFAAPSASIKWKTQWNPSSYYDYAHAVCSDGKYIYVIGYTLDEGDGDDLGASPLIAKVDPQTGQVLNYIKYEPYDGTADDDWDYLYDCVIVGNYLYAVGVTASFGNYGRHLVKIDLSSFTKVSEYNYNYQSSYSDFWSSIDSDGNYLYVAGSYYDGSDYYFVVQKLDLDGNVLATYTVDAESTFGCRSGSDLSCNGGESTSAIKYYDGYVYFGGSYECKGDWGGDGNVDDYDRRTVIVKLNANDLSLVAYKVKDWYTQTREGYQAEYLCRIDVDNTGVYATGYYVAPNPNSGGDFGKAFLWKLDLDLNEVGYSDWWSSLNNNYGAAGYKVKVFKGYSLVAGYESDGSHSHQTFRIFDKNLNNVFTLVLDEGSYNSYFPIGKMYLDEANKILYVAGYDYKPGNYEWTIYALDLSFGVLSVKISYPQDSQTIYVSQVPLKYIVTNTSALPDYFVVNLSNPNSYDLTDYQVRIDLSDYLSSATYLKVTDTNGSLLNFCYEQSNGECNTNPSLIIWVKVLSIPANGSTTIYIYPSDTNYATTGDSVFDFYDDFNDGVLDTDKWQVVGLSDGTYEEANGVLHWNGKGSDLFAFIAKNFQWQPYMIAELRGRDYATQGPKTLRIVYYWDGASTIRVGAAFIAADLAGYDEMYLDTDSETSLPTTSVTLPDTDTYIVSLKYDGLNLYLSIYDETTGEQKVLDYARTPEVTVNYFGTASNGNEAEVDWVRVRKYADQEPSITITPVADTSQQFTAEIWVDGQFVRNETVNNTVEKETTVEILKEGSHAIEVKVWDPELQDYVSDSVTINLDLYDENVTYGGYVAYNGTNYAETLNYTLKVRCGALNRNITVSLLDGSEVKTYTIPCDNTTRTITDSYKPATEGSHTLMFHLHAVDSADDRDFGEFTALFDYSPPEVTILEPELTKYGVVSSLTFEFHYKDLSPGNCTYFINDVNNTVEVAPNSNYSTTFTPEWGWNNLSVTCVDILGHEGDTASKTILKGYKVLYLRIFDEDTNDPVTANVTITGYDTNYSKTVTNVSEATIEVDYANRYYILAISSTNYPQRNFLIYIPDDAPVFFDAYLVKAGDDVAYSKIYVTDYYGKPVQGAFVRVTTRDDKEVCSGLSDVEGKVICLFDYLKTYKITVTKESLQFIGDLQPGSVVTVTFRGYLTTELPSLEIYADPRTGYYKELPTNMTLYIESKGGISINWIKAVCHGCKVNGQDEVLIENAPHGTTLSITPDANATIVTVELWVNTYDETYFRRFVWLKEEMGVASIQVTEYKALLTLILLIVPVLAAGMLGTGVGLAALILLGALLSWAGLISPIPVMLAAILGIALYFGRRWM